MKVNTNKAQMKLKAAKANVKRDMSKEMQALSKGLYLAMSNANVRKGTGVKPKYGSKRAANGDWKESPELIVEYKVWHGKVVRRPVTYWIEKLKQKTRTEIYTDKNGKTRRRKVRPFVTMRMYNQRKEGVLYPSELWRIGSKGQLPYSWGAKGKGNPADYYLRKNWRSKANGLEAEVRISPTQLDGDENNERVLKMLDEGGTFKGARKMLGFRLFFRYNKAVQRTEVGIRQYHSRERRTVTIKGYHFKEKTLARINRTLKKIAPSKIDNQQWRRLGANK